MSTPLEEGWFEQIWMDAFLKLVMHQIDKSFQFIFSY